MTELYGLLCALVAFPLGGWIGYRQGDRDGYQAGHAAALAEATAEQDRARALLTSPNRRVRRQAHRDSWSKVPQ